MSLTSAVSFASFTSWRQAAIISCPHYLGVHNATLSHRRHHGL